jgi:hypothetical protein
LARVCRHWLLAELVKQSCAPAMARSLWELLARAEARTQSSGLMPANPGPMALSLSTVLQKT